MYILINKALLATYPESATAHSSSIINVAYLIVYLDLSIRTLPADPILTSCHKAYQTVKERDYSAARPIHFCLICGRYRKHYPSPIHAHLAGWGSGGFARENVPRQYAVHSFKRRRRANIAMPANTAVPLFLTSSETEMHIWKYG